MPKGRPRGSGSGVAIDFELDEGAAMDAYTFADEVINQLEDIGVNREERPRVADDHVPILTGVQEGDYFDGRLPVVIRQLTLDQLSALLSLFSNWYGYLMYQTQKVAVEHSEAQVQAETLYAMIRQQKRIDADGNKRDPTSMTNATKCDGRYIAANSKLVRLKGLYACLEAMTKIADKDMRTVSRQLTFLQTKIEQDGNSGRSGRGTGRRFSSKTFRPGGEDGEDENDPKPRPKRSSAKKIRRRRRG